MMMSWDPSGAGRVPLSMKTGRDLSTRNAHEVGLTTTYATLFEAAAKAEFEKRGFAFYATELAKASLLATKVINLVFILYGKTFLERIFSELLNA